LTKDASAIGSSGGILLRSGDASSGRSGDILLNSGSVLKDGKTGDIVLSVGLSSYKIGGEVNMFAGDSSLEESIGGSVNINAGSV
jgi:hypothetical protein